MTPLLIHLRLSYLIAHAAHHAVTGTAFFADHERLGKHYEAYETAYDTLIERAIGTVGLGITEATLNLQAASKAKQLSDPVNLTNPADAFRLLLKLETELQSLLKTQNDTASLGTQNLLAQFADDSEARCYQLKQRLG